MWPWAKTKAPPSRLAANGRPISVGHYCALATSADVAAIGKELATAGYPAPGGGFGLIPDPDGLELQLFKPPAGLVTAAVPSDLVPSRKGLVTPLGVDHVLLHVADLEKGVRFYRILYGVETLRDRTTGRAWFQIGDTRLGLQQADAGQKPHIAHFGVKVAPFDQQKVTAGLVALGARVIPSPYEPDVVRLTDPDGISFEVVART